MSDLEDDIDDVSEEYQEEDPQLDEDQDEDQQLDEESQIKEEKNIKCIIIDKDKRMTSDMISPFELSNIIGVRSKTIESSLEEPMYVSIEGVSNTIEIAIKEILLKRCPLTIERIVYKKNNIIKVERWDVNELIIPDLSNYQLSSE